MNKFIICLTWVLTSIVLAACSTISEEIVSEPEISAYFQEDAKSVTEDIFIGGQPQEIDIAALKTQGIAHVVNFRTPEEMARLDFDEASILDASGISYTPIPIGGDDYPYNPEAVSKLTEFMKGRTGPVLLHCGSGYRASVVTVAWLVEEEGMPLNEALTHAQGWWPLRLEQVTGKTFTLVED